jgi:predicted HAD superfamily phosphohydrolase YqeG
MISGNEMQFSEALRAINQVELETLSALTERCVIVDLREKDDFLIAALSGNDFNNQSEDVRTFKNHDIVIICAEKNQYQKVGKISQKIQTLGRFLIYVYVE